ncbi:MAG: MFS transporter [Hydrotalea sp. AMD]|uniref:MFS transporter n=1 Tax=Hydrotalea sp. AMD TaxID=2501297 RepID=UPI00094375FD|nr:MFS transporter [Hydrotalea sp. AMD]RWZ89505.1 MAG: MFS transporter [Hydrotalea sp. AMD]
MQLKKATVFVILLGCTSLFSDMTYEAARSINGPYLEVLGASATTVGWMAGLGELLGYSLRVISGYLSDKTKNYWAITVVGYFINLLSVPLLAFAGFWQLAIMLMILERVGKAIRTPARDAMLSFGAHQMGQGWGFGLHEALDQTGATIGPLLVSAALFIKNNNYQSAYIILFIPAIIAIGLIIFAKSIYPHLENLEIKTKSLETKGYPKLYWQYLIAIAFLALGYADFPLIAYHFKSTNLMPDDVIPLLYALAMASDGIAALILGKVFDKSGTKALVLALFIALFFGPMVFLGGMNWAIVGMVVWGIGMGAQESIVKATVAHFIPPEKRGTAFGVFNAVFGLFWFAGSALMGYLYDYSIIILVAFSIIAQLIALVLLAAISGKIQQYFHTQQIR